MSLLDRLSRYDCRQCKDTGVVTVEERVDNSTLSPQDRAWQIAFGGYAVRDVEVPCDGLAHVLD